MTTINLLPDDYVQRGQRRRANILCASLLGLVMAAVVSAALVSERSSQNTRQFHDEVQTSYAYAAKQLQQMQELETRRQNMQARMDATASLIERVPRSHLLAVITNALPENASLTRIDLDTKRVVAAVTATPTVTPGATKFDALSAARSAATKARQSVVFVEVIGLAGTDVDVARLIANLARNRLVAGVDLVFSQEKVVDSRTIREFQIHMELRSGVDAVNDNAEALARAGVEQ